VSGLGILLAPRSSANLRSQLSARAGDLANAASDGYRKATERARKLASEIGDAAGALAEKSKDTRSASSEGTTSIHPSNDSPTPGGPSGGVRPD
jgi:gas vesicle protein